MKKLIFVAVILLSLYPLAQSGLFDVHDPTSIVRFATLRSTLLDGQIPAAWSNMLNHGFGYPIFLYYAPLFSYLGALLSFVLPSYILTLKLSLVLLTFVAGLGMYKLMRPYGSAVALLSAPAYTLLPYHALALYVRGSYAELSTMAILPYLLYVWSRHITNKKLVVTTALCTALFFISHNSLPFVFIPFLIWWILLHQRQNTKYTLSTLLLSVGLVAWFLLPVILERSLVQVESVATATKLSDHFLSLSQLWHSPWGYGGSAPNSGVDGMSFMLGKFQLLLTTVTITYLTVTKKWEGKNIFLVALLLVMALGTTNSSAPLWSLIPTLSILQFPWRLLAFASFAAAALAGLSVLIAPPKFCFVSAILLIIALLFFNLKFFKPLSIINYTDSEFLSQEKLDTTAASKIPEYLPSTMPSFPTTSVDDGLTRTATKVFGTINHAAFAPITISTAYMPQWQLKLGKEVVAIHASENGTITTVLPIPPGEYMIELTWHRTWIETSGIIISSLSLIVMIGLWIL